MIIINTFIIMLIIMFIFNAFNVTRIDLALLSYLSIVWCRCINIGAIVPVIDVWCFMIIIMFDHPSPLVENIILLLVLEHGYHDAPISLSMCSVSTATFFVLH